MALRTTGGLAGQPILILREGSSRRRGGEAQRANIQAAKVVAEVVKATLGPRGMDKMLVDSLGDITITNDGHEILKEIDVEHPAAKMIVEVAKTQDDEVGDGTTTAVILAGDLLKRAEELLDKKVIMELNALGNIEKKFFCEFVLTYIYKLKKARQYHWN